MVKASLRVLMKALAVRGRPSGRMNAGPSRGGHVMDTYLVQAVIGQYRDPGIAGISMLAGSGDLSVVFDDRTWTQRPPIVHCTSIAHIVCDGSHGWGLSVSMV